MVRRYLVLVLFASVLSACAGLPDNTGRSESRAYSDVHNPVLADYIDQVLADQPGKSGTIILSNGVDAFVARAVLAELAVKSIDVQYYLYHGDLTGRLLTYQLLRAADRGVRVRLLVDDMAISNTALAPAVLDSHPNLEVRIFNPFSREHSRLLQYVTRLGSVTRRMHNKTFTVDNTVSILGGRNVGDEYFGADKDMAFSDLDVMGFGPFVPEVSGSFDRYWNSELSYPAAVLAGESPGAEELDALRKDLEAFVASHRDSDYREAMRDSELANSLRAGNTPVHLGTVDVLYDQPEKISASRDRVDYRLTQALAPHVVGIKRELLVFSPYFVPGKAGIAMFRDLVKRGVRVVIMTNSLSSTDVAMVHAGYARSRVALLEAGVELFELNTRGIDRQTDGEISLHGSSQASLHAKSFIMDREKIFIGSMNLDPRSEVENTEIGIILHSPEEVAPMAEAAEQWIRQAGFALSLDPGSDLPESILWSGTEDGQPVTFRVEPYSSGWSRFLVDVFRLLPIDSQL